MTCLGAELKNNATTTLSVTFYSAQGATLTTGSYTVQQQVPLLQIVYSNDQNQQFFATSGSGSLTKISDTNYQGTLSSTLLQQGTGSDIELTNGQFNCNTSMFGF